MTTAERSAQLAQDIAADVRTLRGTAARLADQQSQLVAMPLVMEPTPTLEPRA